MQPIQYQTDLTPYNTFGLKAQAQAFVALKHADELHDIVRLPEFDRDTVLWLGGGSNILLMEDYAGLVVHMENKGIREIERSDGLVYIEAQAGEIWHDFVLHTVGLGLSGLENLSLIPGTVGASPVQNIGAYGVEVKDVIHSVRCFDLNTETFVELSNADCDFAYRESLFKQEGKGRYVIVSVVFALKEHFVPNLGYGDLAAAVAELSQGARRRPKMFPMQCVQSATVNCLILTYLVMSVVSLKIQLSVLKKQPICCSNTPICHAIRSLTVRSNSRPAG